MAEIKFKSALVDSLNHKVWDGTKFENNEKLVDNAGFVPLDIRFKKLDVAMAQRKLAVSQFDYHEYDELYDDDIMFDKYDSLEELQQKVEIFTTRKNELLARKFAEFKAVRQNENNLQANKQSERSSEKSVENDSNKSE